jgi:radical SAM superfamily enzyme YgiQ (UPF0313 family)
LGRIILQKRPSVDFVMTGNAELDFLWIVVREIAIRKFGLEEIEKNNAFPSEEIGNLYFRNKAGNPVFTFNRNPLMNVIVNPDFIHPSYKKNPFPVSFIRGCIKTVRTGKRCSFCSLGYKGLDVMKPELAWQQIRILWEKHGIDYFFETGDSFIPEYYKRLIKTRPNDLEHIRFRIYASPRQINDSTIRILKRMNVREVFLGLETNSDLVLKKAGKDYCFKDEIRALELLTRAGIFIQLPFIYGLPGSTTVTETSNYVFAKYAVENYNIHSLLASGPIPLVGSELYEMVTGGEIKSDIIDYEKLTRKLIENFSECSFEQVMEFIQETSLLKDEIGGFWVTN